MGFALQSVTQNQIVYNWTGSESPDNETVPRSIFRDDENKRTVYMSYIPWSYLRMTPEEAIAGKQISVAVTVNDRNIAGSHWANQTALALFDGIATTKDHNLYGVMTLVSAEPDKEVTLVNATTSTRAADIKIREIVKHLWEVTFDVTEIFDDGTSQVVTHTVLFPKNSNGRIDLGEYTLIYDVKGNGSNIKDFRIVMN